MTLPIDKAREELQAAEKHALRADLTATRLLTLLSTHAPTETRFRKHVREIRRHLRHALERVEKILEEPEQEKALTYVKHPGHGYGVIRQSDGACIGWWCGICAAVSGDANHEHFEKKKEGAAP